MSKKLRYCLLILLLPLLADSCQKKSTKIEGTEEGSPPVLTGPVDGRIIAGETFISTDFSVSDPDSDSILVSILDIKPSATSNPEIVENHVLWVTTDNEIGDHAIRLVASDPGGSRDTCEFTVNVFNQPTDFPSMIGSKFVYSLFDSISMTSDTVNVYIVGTAVFDGDKQATIWEYEFSSRIDTEYVYFSGDTVKVYDKLSSWWINTKYVFPLEVGKGWRGDFWSDTNTVVERATISVPAGDFPETFIIEENWSELNSYGDIVTWFVPEVGIIRKRHREVGFGFIAELVWELIDYRCYPFGIKD